MKMWYNRVKKEACAMLEKREYIFPCQSYEKHGTFYRDDAVPLRAVALYFHGGALLYGSREDLPQYHLEQLCGAGCGVLAMDYPLAPGAAVEDILADVKESVSWYLQSREKLFSEALPYFLWGRSAGGYLCLTAMERGLPEPPAGVLSYYGYGLLCPGWYDAPSPFYLRYPRVPESCLAAAPRGMRTQGELERYYFLYVHLRQTGKWGEYLLGGKGGKTPGLDPARPPERPCPILLTHSREDPDVPFAEFEALSRRYPDSCRMAVPLAVHDFDSDVTRDCTKELLQMSVEFIRRNS